MLKVKDINVYYGKIHALKNVSFEVRPGEVVADLCAGSGTTAVAALNTGRRFVCFESAPAIYGPAVQRIEQARLAVERGEKGE